MGLPQIIERDQGGRSIAAAAAQTCAHRDIFFQLNVGTQLRHAFGLFAAWRALLQMGFQCQCRAVNQVIVHTDAGAVRQVNLPVMIRCDVNFVAPVDALKNGFQTVVAVRATSGDVQEPVDFRGALVGVAHRKRAG